MLLKLTDTSRKVYRKEAILEHFSLVLKLRFAIKADNYPEADDMTAAALAFNIIYWSKETDVIS